jgi:hypothetical protein
MPRPTRPATSQCCDLSLQGPPTAEDHAGCSQKFPDGNIRCRAGARLEMQPAERMEWAGSNERKACDSISISHAEPQYYHVHKLATQALADLAGSEVGEHAGHRAGLVSWRYWTGMACLACTTVQRFQAQTIFLGNP